MILMEGWSALLFEDFQVAGSHTLAWNRKGHVAGVYFYRIESGAYVVMERIVVLE